MQDHKISIKLFPYDDAFESLNNSGLKCEMCGLAFKRKFSYERHIRVVHLDQRPYECSCTKRFATKEQLARHMTSKHTTEKPFLCEKGCQKSFTSKNARYYHNKIHHENQKFRCEYLGCSREFSSLYHLRTHNEKPHELSFHKLTEKLEQKNKLIIRLKSKLKKLKSEKIRN